MAEHDNGLQQPYTAMLRMSTYSSPMLLATCRRFTSHDFALFTSVGILVSSSNDARATIGGLNPLLHCTPQVPVADILCCKPSEMAFYPLPKLMIRRVGDHEAHSATRAVRYDKRF